MVGFRWVLIHFLLLQITEPVAGQLSLYVTVRDGDEVTLPCNSLIDDQQNCDSTVWVFIDSRRTLPVVVLVRDGKIVEAAKAKSDRLSVSEKCSLVIKKVTDEDGSLYYCRQFRSEQQQGPDAGVLLSVVTMTEHKNKDKVMLKCSVSTYLKCDHTVKWLLQGQVVDKDNKDLKTSQSSCSASLTFLTSHFISTSRFNSLKCQVTRGDKVQQFSFRNSPSGETTGETTGDKTGWWLYIGVALGLAALLIIAVTVVRCIKTRANRTQVDDNNVLTTNPAETQSAPEDRQDPADPEEGVSYASISHTGKTNSKAQVRGGEDAVTYSTVRHPSTADNNLYATVNRPPK
ncbi:uncharacterized protein [Cebidichthys violaceus]|uniref:uncharacterized protein n=1 Tax=Cebidichthys violaceus TaxID=271503 RepID=UPI0035CB6910